MMMASAQRFMCFPLRTYWGTSAEIVIHYTSQEIRHGRSPSVLQFTREPCPQTYRVVRLADKKPQPEARRVRNLSTAGSEPRFCTVRRRPFGIAADVKYALRTSCNGALSMRTLDAAVSKVRMVILLAATATLLALAPEAARAETIVVGNGNGGSPQVSVYDGANGSLVGSFLAYGAGFTGGVRVATGDVNGDGVPDVVTGAGPGGDPVVKVFDGVSGVLIRSFFAFDPSFTGGVFVAAGDVNADGAADIIVGADGGGQPNVKVFDGATGAVIRSFLAYSVAFSGGVRVAAGDVNGDGIADIVTGAGSGGEPHVEVFDGATGTLIQSFFAFDPSFTGGVFVAAGDINGDGRADIVVGADAGGAPHVKVFDAVTGSVVQSFFAFASNFTGGVRVAVGDLNGDGVADLVTGAGPGGDPVVAVFDGRTGALIGSFFSRSPQFTGGIYVASTRTPIESLSNLVAAARQGLGQNSNLLENSLRSLGANNVGAACNMLSAFINQLNAQSGKSLAVSEANQFMVSAMSIRSGLGCR
jgi:hypothetical protein